MGRLKKLTLNSQSGNYEEFHLLGYNVSASCLLHAGISFNIIFDPEDRGVIFLRIAN
jgi:hypothetical protein